MKTFRKSLLIYILPICLLPILSCTDKERIRQAQNIVINEVMASNRTGLLTEKGKPEDWIEIKNTSKDSIDLKGFKLSVIKDNIKPDSIEEKESKEEILTWKFPDVKIGGEECLVIIAKKIKEGKKEDQKKKNKESKKEEKISTDNILKADLKLPKGGGTIQFQAPNGQVITEVKYGKMAPDQSLSRQPDSTYLATYWQSPGYDNNRDGYEAASQYIDSQRKSPVLIWELMSRAKDSHENFVELKNVGQSEVDLSAYSISKKSGKNESWQLPAKKLQPGEIITIQLAGKKANKNNPLQAPFKLGNAETLILYKDGKFADGMCAKNTIYGGSVGRSEKQKGIFYYSSPTRGANNGDGGKRYIADKPEFNIKPGIYSKEQKLKLHLKVKSRKVHYTLDGSEPTMSSPILGDSLILTKSTVIRTLAEGDSTTLKSNVATTTYLLGVEHDMPVVNITVNKSDLYDYNTGIYADGPGYSPEFPHLGANFWKNWTKKAHVELFDDKEGISVDCGLKIFGGFSRFEPKKSFRLKFRSEYGDSEVDYDFFGNGNSLELEDLVLRSGSQDYNRCMVRDEFFTSLMKAESPELLTQLYRPVALYVNAEYFGLYFIREKIDNHFVARKLNLPNDSIDIIMSLGYVEEGSGKAYNDLMKYVSTHDLTVPENYEYVSKNVDLQGLIDYKLGEIFSGNSDVGNIRYVRSTAPQSDKKWHFIFYDLDATWVGDQCTPSFYLSDGPDAVQKGVAAHNKLIGRLLHNKNFRELFLQRLSHHMTNTFSTANTTKVFDNLVTRIQPEMKRNCERWPQLSYDSWEKNIKSFRSKFETRPKIVLNALREYLSVTEAENKKYFGKLGY